MPSPEVPGTGSSSSSSSSDPRTRFTDRVDAYVRHRPGYPDDVVRFLERIGIARPGMTVADIGSGTGISAQLFLRNGYRVIGVEPNAAMRAAAERLLGAAGGLTGGSVARHSDVEYGRIARSVLDIGMSSYRAARLAAPTQSAGEVTGGTFRSVNGSAEFTTLPDGSVDLVIAGQAFHWFDRPAAKREFRRVLRRDGSSNGGGGVALFWNSRKLTGSPFAEGYESLLLEYATDYAKVRHDEIGAAAIADFLGPAQVESATFPNRQRFDYAGLEGRLLSSSYVPPSGGKGHEEMLAALRRLFDRCQVGGEVVMEYGTEVYASI